MGMVGKTPNQRSRVSVKTSSLKETKAVESEKDSSFPTATYISGLHSSSANPPPISSQQVAAYIAEMCLQLVLMAKGVNLPLVAHLLAMAQAEAQYAAEKI